MATTPSSVNDTISAVNGSSNKLPLIETIIHERFAFMRQFGYYPNHIVLGDNNYDDLLGSVDANRKDVICNKEGKADMIYGMEILRSRTRNRLELYWLAS